MSLVFGSVFLFILISPGLIFRFSYLQGTYAKLTFKVSAVEEVFWALVPALFFQLLGILIVENVFNVPVNLDVIYQLITGKETDFGVVRSSLLPFLVYLSSLILFSIIAGVAVRLFIRYMRLDLYLQFLRFGNEWYYLLSGEILNLPKKTTLWFNPMSNYWAILRKPKTKIQMIQIDALVNSSEGNVIYSGILENYFLSQNNGLDRIYLTNVYRRKLKDDLEWDKPNPGFLARDTDERYYSMPGYLLVLMYDKILNLNVTYYTDESTDSDDEDEYSAE
jgi:hypothetical protein